MPTTNITAALRPLSPTYRGQVRDELRRRGLPVSGPLKPTLRKALEDAIFAVENELEHRSVAHGGSAHPAVTTMRCIRNVLLDEVPASMGGNETHEHLRWPLVEAVAALMHERRRKGGATHLPAARRGRELGMPSTRTTAPTPL